MLFYSDNANEYNFGEYTSSLNKNGNCVKNTVKFSVNENQPFVCISEMLDVNETVDTATFRNKDGKEYTY